MPFRKESDELNEMFKLLLLFYPGDIKKALTADHQASSKASRHKEFHLWSQTIGCLLMITRCIVSVNVNAQVENGNLWPMFQQSQIGVTGQSSPDV